MDGKVRFLFQIYDQNGLSISLSNPIILTYYNAISMPMYDMSIIGDGVIKLGELKSVLTACSKENGMQFNDAQMNQLTLALYKDAKQCEHAAFDDDGIDFTEFKAQMIRKPGLLENLSTG